MNEYSIKLTEKDIISILNKLAQHPFIEVNILINTIESQVQAQNKPTQKSG